MCVPCSTRIPLEDILTGSETLYTHNRKQFHPDQIHQYKKTAPLPVTQAMTSDNDIGWTKHHNCCQRLGKQCWTNHSLILVIGPQLINFRQKQWTSYATQKPESNIVTFLTHLVYVPISMCSLILINVLWCSILDWRSQSLLHKISVINLSGRIF